MSFGRAVVGAFLFLAQLPLPSAAQTTRLLRLPWSDFIGVNKDGSSVEARVARRGAIGCLNVAQKVELVGVEETDRHAALQAVMAHDGATRLIVLFDRPPPGHLGIVGMVGPGIPAGTLLTSPTTRTPGLIAAIDLTSEGRAPEFLSAGNNLGFVHQFERGVAAIEASKDATLATYGALAGCAVLLGLVALRHRRWAVGARLLLCVAAAGTLTQLAVGAFPQVEAPHPHPEAYPFVFLALSGTIGAAAWGFLRGRAQAAILLTLAVGIALDTILHLQLVASSPLSAFYLAGIRYYGIGNEFMGLLLGALFMAVPTRFVTAAGIASTLLLGLPMLGADAGGALAAAFGTAIWALPARWGWRRTCVAFALGLAAAFGVALLDRLEPASAQSHIGRAAGAGAGAWGAIVGRKLAMNLRISTALPTLIALAGLLPVWWTMARARFCAPIRDAVTADPDLRRRLNTALWTALAALAFNDSGIVAALLLLAPVTTTVIERALATEPVA